MKRRGVKVIVSGLVASVLVTVADVRPANALINPGSLINAFSRILQQQEVDMGQLVQEIMSSVIPQVLNMLCGTIENNQAKGLCQQIAPLMQQFIQDAVKGKTSGVTGEQIRDEAVRVGLSQLPDNWQSFNGQNSGMPVTAKQLAHLLTGASMNADKNTARALVQLQSGINEATNKTYEEIKNATTKGFAEEANKYTQKVTGGGTGGHLGAIKQSVTTIQSAKSELDVQKELAKLLGEKAEIDVASFDYLHATIAASTIKQIDLAKMQAQSLYYLRTLNAEMLAEIRRLNNQPSQPSLYVNTTPFAPLSGAGGTQ